MLRRDLLRVLGGAGIASVLAPLSPEQRLGLGRRLHAAVASGPGPLAALSAEQAGLVAELADLIIPRTDAPGATDVRVVEFIDRILGFWDTSEERERFLAGLDAIDAQAGETGFAALSPEGKVVLLTRLDDAPDRPAGSAEAAWTRLKGMVVYGYFTSREVQQQVLRTPIIPGRYQGCRPARGA